MAGGGGGWVFIAKNILVLDMQEKQKMAQEWFWRNNMVSKIVKKKILDPYDGNYSILFDISKCH